MTTPEVQAAVAHLDALSRLGDLGPVGMEALKRTHATLLSALAASEARRGELEGYVRKLNLAVYAVGVQLNNNRIPRQSRILNALEVLDALDPEQEGSRDHG